MLEQKTLKISHNAQSINEILGAKNLSTAKQSKFKICEKCKENAADSMAGILCHVCYRKILYEKLPEEQQRLELLMTVPEQFLVADLSHLAKGLRIMLTRKTETGVFLWGPPGVGKSYALCALAKSLVAEGYIVRRVNYELLCLKIRDTFKPTAKQSEWEVIEPFIECDKLIIEDIGTTRSIDSKESDFSLRTLLVLLDLRLEHCRSTYISTNKSVENLAKSFDARVGDRLRMYAIAKISGESKRKSC